MENLTQSWIQSGPFFQNKGTIFDFQKRGWDACPSRVAQLLRSAFLKLSKAFTCHVIYLIKVKLRYSQGKTVLLNSVEWLLGCF